MKDHEIESRNEDIAEAMKQYEAHTWKDHDDLLMLREQGSAPYCILLDSSLLPFIGSTLSSSLICLSVHNEER
jgi:hypothetical protein